jgi:hypothetical protein
MLRCELRVERLDPEPHRQIRVTPGLAVHEVSGPEAPRVDVEEPVPVIEEEPHPGVNRFERRIEEKRARHSEVDEQIAVLRKRPHEVLAHASYALDDRAAELLLDPVRKLGTGPPWVQDLGLEDRAALEVGSQLAADRFYLWELGHDHERTT